jgi:predicted PurR-regulated permease PerM
VSETTQGVKYVKDTLRSEGVTGLVHKLPPSLQSLATSAWARFAPRSSGSPDEAMTQQLNARTGSMAAMATTIAVWTGSFLFQSAMLLIALYFLLIDGPALIKWLDSVVPLKPGEFRELLAQFRGVSKAVIVSSAITAAIQALAALAGFLIAKVPLPVFFAGLTFIFAFIPAIGASSISVLAAALLYFTGHPYMALSRYLGPRRRRAHRQRRQAISRERRHGNAWRRGVLRLGGRIGRVWGRRSHHWTTGHQLVHHADQDVQTRL